MLDHFTLRVRDIAATRAFYTAALAPLGYVNAFDAVHDGAAIVGFGFTQENGSMRIDSWFIDHREPVSGPTHLCWVAATRAQVDAFHAAALAAGGQDNGPPGLRAHYGPSYYGGFVIDPDGNNVEAVCRAAA